MRSFLILGLPRSRTAWLSSLFTVGNVFCYHDLTSRSRTADEVIARMQQNPTEVCGNSDSGNIFILDRVMEIMPETRLALICREPGEVVRSMAAAAREPRLRFRDPIARLHARNSQYFVKYGGKAFMYEDLDREARIRELWEHLTGGVEFPVDHWEKLRTMRVVIHDDIMRSAINGTHECRNSEITKHASTILAGRAA